MKHIIVDYMKISKYIQYILLIFLIIPNISYSYFYYNFNGSLNNYWNKDIYMIDSSQRYVLEEQNNQLNLRIQRPYRDSNHIFLYSKYIINGSEYNITFLFKKEGYGRTTQGIYFDSRNYFVVGFDTNDVDHLYSDAKINGVHKYRYYVSTDPYLYRKINLTLSRKKSRFYIFVNGRYVGSYTYPQIEDRTKPRVILWHEVMRWKSGDCSDKRYSVYVYDAGNHYNGNIDKILKITRNSTLNWISNETNSTINGETLNATIEIKNNKNGSPYTGTINIQNSIIKIEDHPCKILLYENNGNGIYNIIFGNPTKILGNLSIIFSLNLDNAEKIKMHKNYFRKTNKKSHLLFVTDKDFYNILFVSVLNQPVLVYQKFNVSYNNTVIQMDNFNGIKDFTHRYNPNKIFYLGDGLENIQKSLGGYKIKNREELKKIWEPNRLIIIDKNKTKDILAGWIAIRFNSQLTMNENVSSNAPIICTFDCKRNDSQNIYTDKSLYNFIQKNSNYVNGMVIANTYDNLSAFSPQIFRYRNTVPVVISVYPTYKNLSSNLNNKIFEIENKMENTYLWSKKYRDPIYKAKNEFFVYLIGAPYGYLEDPGMEIFNNYDGDYLFTDVVYSDVDFDGSPDFQVGRITDPLQIHNANDFNSRTKKALIIGEYRHPRYIDIIPGGMESSLLADLATRSLNINTKRYAEERLQDMSEFENEDFLDQYLTWYQLEEYFIQQLLKIIKIQKYVNWALTYKYSLLEFDWGNFVKHGTLKRLERPKKSEILNDLKNKNMIFFFGLGDNYSWTLPPDKPPNNRDLIFDPYPEDSPKIYSNSIINHSILIYDDHSMGANPKSSFIYSPLAYYGATGIVHDPASTINFIGYFKLFGLSNSLGRSSKPFTVTPKTYKDITIMNKVKESTSQIKRDILLKDYFQRTLYGDPMITINENYFLEKPKYKIKYSKHKFTISIKEKPKIEKNNTEISVTDFNGYDIDYNKPIIQTKTYEFEIPKNSKIKSIEYKLKTHVEKNITIPILKPDEHYPQKPFTGKYPQKFIENVSISGENKKIIITVFPIIYKNYTDEEAEIIDDIDLNITYESPLGIISFNAINGTEGSNITFFSNIVANGSVNITIIIINSNGTYSINKTTKIDGEQEINMKWNNSKPGNYTAIIIVSQNDSEVRSQTNFVVKRRKHSSFVGKIKRFNGPEKTGYMVQTPFEMLSYIRSHDIENFTYMSDDCYIEIVKSSSDKKITFVTVDGYLLIFENSTSIIKHFWNPKGEIISTLINGSESITGDTSIAKEMEKFNKYYNSNISSIKSRIEAGEFGI